MFTALRSARIQPPSIFSTNLPKYHSVQTISGVRFRQATANCSDKNEVMEKSKSETQTQSQPQTQINQHDDKKGDVMSHSFGEGYSSRSDDDGFGGIYGGNDSLSEDEKVEEIHVSHPDYDKDQGSEVKEKEKARHQTHAHS